MHKVCIAASILAAIAGAGITHQLKASSPPDVEKCYGVAKAGKNDCASKDASNSCAGLSLRDDDTSQWVYVPKGLCERLTGGMKG